jgi:uncharacterized membrane protein YbhN (UPF0104 family)
MRSGLVRRLLALVVLLGAPVSVVFAVPSLVGVRHDLTAIDGWWLAAAVALEIASCVSFVAVFRAFFDRVPSRLARRIAWIEMGSGALLPGGGVTSYALGGLLLNRAGMDGRSVVVRSGGVFWLTSAVNAVALVIGALLLLAGVGGGPHDFYRALLPAVIATPVALLIAFSPALAGRRSRGVRRARRGRGREWPTMLVDGVADAWRAARHPTWRLAGAIGYLGFDMAVLACIFRGLGYRPDAGALMLGYLVGYCAAAIPVPAAIGVLEGGLAGALVLYGAPADTTVAAVLIYHAVAFAVPSLGALGAGAGLVRSLGPRSGSAADLGTARELQPERRAGALRADVSVCTD